MPKIPSTITVSSLANGSYALKATGSFGGGYTKPTTAEYLPGAIIRAWQIFGDNPLGCIITTAGLPAEVQALVDKLQGDGATRRGVTLRVTAAELAIMHGLAAEAELSLNEWMRRTLVRS